MEFIPFAVFFLFCLACTSAKSAVLQAIGWTGALLCVAVLLVI